MFLYQISGWRNSLRELIYLTHKYPLDVPRPVYFVWPFFKPGKEAAWCARRDAIWQNKEVSISKKKDVATLYLLLYEKLHLLSLWDVWDLDPQQKKHDDAPQ